MIFGENFHQSETNKDNEVLRPLWPPNSLRGQIRPQIVMNQTSYATMFASPRHEGTLCSRRPIHQERDELCRAVRTVVIEERRRSHAEITRATVIAPLLKPQQCTAITTCCYDLSSKRPTESVGPTGPVGGSSLQKSVGISAETVNHLS